MKEGQEEEMRGGQRDRRVFEMFAKRGLGLLSLKDFVLLFCAPMEFDWLMT